VVKVAQQDGDAVTMKVAIGPDGLGRVAAKTFAGGGRRATVPSAPADEDRRQRAAVRN